MWLRLGSVPAMVASTPDMAREILKTHDLEFASRPPTKAANRITFGLSDIAYAPYGPHWRLMRQLCVADLFSNRRIEDFRPVREEQLALLMRSIWEDSTTGREVQIRPRLSYASSNLISRMTMGKKLSELVSGSEDASRNFVELLYEAMRLLGAFNLGDFIPFVQWMDLQGYLKRITFVAQNFRDVFQGIIDARRELRRESSTGSPRDLLDVLLSISEEGTTDVPMPDDVIKAVILDMFLGGNDTSSLTVEWALAELLRNPTIMKKLQEEIDGAIGKTRLVQEADLSELPYLEAVVKESLRLHPPGPLMLPHESTKECKVGGYTILAKTRTLVNVWAIGRDGGVWERPLEFRPERFKGSQVDVRGQHFELLPFGSGRRGCPAWMLGLLTIKSMLATLVHGFDWSLPPTQTLAPCHSNPPLPLVDMSEQFGVTVLMATPLLALATPRLPPHVYVAHPLP